MLLAMFCSSVGICYVKLAHFDPIIVSTSSFLKLDFEDLFVRSCL